MEKITFINGDIASWAVCKINTSKSQDTLQIVTSNENHTLTLEKLPKKYYDSVMIKLNKWLGVNLKGK